MRINLYELNFRAARGGLGTRLTACTLGAHTTRGSDDGRGLPKVGVTLNFSRATITVRVRPF